MHTACKESLLTKCPLGLCKVSVIPPTALNSIDSDGGSRAPGLSLSSCFPRCAFSSPTLEQAVLVVVTWSGGGQAPSSGRGVCTEVVKGVPMATGHAEDSRPVPS